MIILVYLIGAGVCGLLLTYGVIQKIGDWKMSKHNRYKNGRTMQAKSRIENRAIIKVAYHRIQKDNHLNQRHNQPC